jgi:hypothetical protein
MTRHVSATSVRQRSIRTNKFAPNHRRLGVLIGVTRAVAAGGGQEQLTLDLLDLDAGEASAQRIPLTFPGHGFDVNPRRPREAVLLEKRGCGGCLIDLRERSVVRAIRPMAGHVFYGHCAYAGGGDLLHVVESDVQSGAGIISIRDAETFAVMGTCPTYGVSPHDCHLVESGRTLVITNGGGPTGSAHAASVTFVDVASRKLLEKYEMPARHLNAGHVAVTEDREFAVVSAPREGPPQNVPCGGVTLRRRGDRPVCMDAPFEITSRLIGEALSVAIDPVSRTAVATHPDAGLVTFWSLEAGSLVTTLDLPQPRGVTMTSDRQFFALSHGADARLLFVEARSLCAVVGRRHGAGIFGGAHLYTWTGKQPESPAVTMN